MSEQQPDQPRIKTHKRHNAHRRRRDDDGFDERWGDEEMVEDDDQEAPDPEFNESSSKRVKLSDGSAAPRMKSPTPPAETVDEKERRERDEFAKRLANRDADRSKKIAEDRSAAKDSVAAQRRALADDAVARAQVMPDLRIRSRQDYLQKREAERLALLRKQVTEEQAELRDNPELTKREKEEFARNKEVLRLAEERLNIDEHLDGYALPEDYITERGKIDKRKKEQALYQRYVERDESGREKYVTEHEEWEREQTKRAEGQIKRSEYVDEGDYGYVFDESQQMKFVMSETLGGDLGKAMTREQREMAERLNAAEAKAKSMDETRKSLPIYQFREEIIQAVREHQVLIIVGETGSGKPRNYPSISTKLVSPKVV